MVDTVQVHVMHISHTNVLPLTSSGSIEEEGQGKVRRRDQKTLGRGSGKIMDSNWDFRELLKKHSKRVTVEDSSRGPSSLIQV